MDPISLYTGDIESQIRFKFKPTPRLSSGAGTHAAGVCGNSPVQQIGRGVRESACGHAGPARGDGVPPGLGQF